MLSGNVATDRVTNLNNKATSIISLVFLTQKNSCMVEQECLKNMITKTKNSMDVLDGHKSKPKLLLLVFGTMTHFRLLQPLYQQRYDSHRHHQCRHHQKYKARGY
jgi:hypothetical protein